jgi:hypothetical protein
MGLGLLRRYPEQATSFPEAAPAAAHPIGRIRRVRGHGSPQRRVSGARRCWPPRVDVGQLRENVERQARGGRLC